MSDYWDEEEDERIDEPFVLSFNENGEAKLNKSSDYVQLLESEFKLIRGFIEENQQAFNTYIDKLKNGEEQDD